jgi:hypothetical protein
MTDIFISYARSTADQAHLLAKEEGVSRSHWISVAAAEKIGVVGSVASFLSRRAGDARPADMLSYLDRAPSQPLMAGGER